MQRRWHGRGLEPIAAAILGSACAPPPELGDGIEGPIDEARLDRSVDEGGCGYPSAGSQGYGTEVGQRLANSGTFVLETCEGARVELSDWFCRRDDAYGDYNRGILLNIGAGWCGPCQEESVELPELYEEFHGQGIEIVQVMFQDWTGQTPTAEFCDDWVAGAWAEGEAGEPVMIPWPVIRDESFDWSSRYISDTMAAAPVNLLVDANGNIRWQLQGQKPDLEVVRTQLELVLADPYGG
ncbi:peroxiredoxin family protein [Paraliomyxa miuraensis]|uniref:peroxiredoxin family protein n=1 Tax=Paraliomyxa miuraensis TaxID=376150 RepID=UPI00225ADDDF|nr:TlpA disulfide reductase family protein [Paraliomyxa miuraensis]MCX4240429.1 TlpA family protein disulfide reductase [Paraliomyxa miuraensis]